MVRHTVTGMTEAKLNSPEYYSLRPATEGEIAAYNAAQQQREGEINKQAARDNARYAQYEF